MTGFEIERMPFDLGHVETWKAVHPRAANWPVVYTLDGKREVYVGESLNMASRAKQHKASVDKQRLQTLRVVVGERFNKSVCLDLESFLIRYLSGDGQYSVLNRNDGIIDADYYERKSYEETFREIFEQLRAEGLFTRSMAAIENDDLFKLSPFKALTSGQAMAVGAIVEGLLRDLDSNERTLSVVQGEPGTGKTIVAIYLLKLLRDIKDRPGNEDLESDSAFAEFFEEGYATALEATRIGFVIPQQSLRKSVQEVFKRTPGLERSMVLSPFQAGASAEDFDVLVVDEAHRLGQRANQPSGVLNAKFTDINVALFGDDAKHHTQLDWILAKGRHVILMLDREQSVRPADLPRETTGALLDRAIADGRRFVLETQMRVRAGEDYIGYVRAALSDDPPAARDFEEYDLRFFDDLSEMHDAIRARDAEFGLARLLAGFAWPWSSKTDKSAFDIEIDGLQLQWNRTATDWIGSFGAIDQVGSIHTVQGYDLNYAGVVIGGDVALGDDGRLNLVRESYHDDRGKQGNKQLGLTYSDDDVLGYVRNVYAVLMTRGMRGTYVYVVDPGLRERLRPLFSAPTESECVDAAG